MNVSDSIAIVTGGASGLGEAIIRNLISGGARAAIFDIQEDKGEELAKELGDSVIFAKTDVTSTEDVQGGIEKTIRTFGGVSVVVNCAGFGGSRKVFSTKEGPMPLDFFNLRVQVNLVGTFNVLRLAIEKMMLNPEGEDGEKGVIINTASIAAFEGQIGQAAYSASKAGIVGMTLPIARECAKYGIRVMTIAPGVFNTPLLAKVPDKVRESLGKAVPFPSRLGNPQEYAQLVRHIIENRMLNGEVIRLDGAIRMQPI